MYSDRQPTSSKPRPALIATSRVFQHIVSFARLSASRMRVVTVVDVLAGLGDGAVSATAGL